MEIGDSVHTSVYYLVSDLIYDSAFHSAWTLSDAIVFDLIDKSVWDKVDESIGMVWFTIIP